MKKIEKLAIGASVVIGIGGLACGLYIDGVYFSRSGALIVIVGIIYGLQELPSRLANIDSWARKEARKIRPTIVKNIRDQGADEETANDVYEKSVEVTIEEISKHANKLRKQLVFIESMILIIGTLIWGFGDLVNPVCCAKS